MLFVLRIIHWVIKIAGIALGGARIAGNNSRLTKRIFRGGALLMCFLAVGVHVAGHISAPLLRTEYWCCVFDREVLQFLSAKYIIMLSIDREN